MRVDIELTCNRCGYNLRELDVSGRCPECGQDIHASALDHDPMFIERAMARRTGLHETIIWMVRIALHNLAPAQDFKTSDDITAQEICDATIDAGVQCYGKDAISMFRSVGLVTSELIGEAVFALVDAGLLTASEGDKREDFRGLLTDAQLEAQFAARELSEEVDLGEFDPTA